MSYFPLHYITTNQYSSGGEFMYRSSQIEYIGYYWKTGNGRFYTGETPQSPEILEIVPIIPIDFGISTDQSEYNKKISLANIADGPLDYFPEVANLPIEPNIISDYANLKNIPQTILTPFKYLPQYNPTIPSTQDYQNGEFIRYFTKKTNELQYIEINQQTYALLRQKNPTIEWTLYLPFTLSWQLTGIKKQVQQVNRNITEAKIKSLKLHKFDEYLKFDYTKYYQFPNISNLYTAGGEFKTANGQNYIGFYHIHDKTGPMVGAVHTKEPHEYLFLINETIAPQLINQQTNIKQNQSTSSYNPTPMNMGGGYSGGGGGGY